MSKRIDIGTFSGNETLTWDCSKFIFSRVNVFLHSGGFGGGVINFRAGKKGATEIIKVTSKANTPVSTFSNMRAISVANYTIDVICDEMQFVLAGSTAPTVQLSVYPEPRR